MAIIPTPSVPQTPNLGLAQIVNGSGTGNITLYTGGASGPGSKIFAIVATSTDIAAHDIQLFVLRSAVSYLLGTITVPVGAGNAGTANSINLLDPTVILGLPVDTDGNPFLFLKNSSDTLVAAAVVAVTAGKTINILTIAADF